MNEDYWSDVEDGPLLGLEIFVSYLTTRILQAALGVPESPASFHSSPTFQTLLWAARSNILACFT